MMQILTDMGTNEATDKAFAEGYRLAIKRAADWFEKYLANDNRIDDWCRDSKAVESGKQKFLKFMGE